MNKILMVWMGKTSGTLAGRDDGYPEEKMCLLPNAESVIANYRDDAKYYKLEAVDVSNFVDVYNKLHGT